LGARAPADLVRSGAENALVEAGFELDSTPPALTKRLEEAGIDLDGGEVVIRRELSASGRASPRASARGRIAVNGSAGAATLLRDIAPFVADIHGQGESATIGRPEAGLELLDGAGNYRTEREKVAGVYERFLELEKEADELERDSRDAQARKELLAFQLEEIDRVKPLPGEDSELEEERRLLAHGEKLRSLTSEAYGALYEEEASVVARLAQIWKRVEELADIDPRLETYLAGRESVSSELDDLALFLRDYREQIRSAPGRLDEVEDRLASLERLKKKFGGTLEAVLDHREQCEKEAHRLGHSNQRLAEIKVEMETLGSQYLKAARALSRERRDTAKSLEAKLVRDLRGLAMEKARFVFRVVSAEGEKAKERERWRDSGLDEVELLFSANPGEELRPLSRIASGGELSRFMLALKSVSAHGEPPKTLVFDEVDAGIGGRVADVVGEKLKELSRSHQIICVTHLPQIASFADAHFRIEKTTARGRTVTTIGKLDRKGRVNEIARMLAGAEVTDSARKHAEQLVAEKS
jgi:DNA repair protein RecN (Recombination protein N)